MTDTKNEPISTTNLDQYGSAELPWSRPRDVLASDTPSADLTAPFSAPSAGPPPWHLYRLTLHTAIGVAGTEPGGATRWDFAR